MFLRVEGLGVGVRGSARSRWDATNVSLIQPELQVVITTYSCFCGFAGVFFCASVGGHC